MSEPTVHGSCLCGTVTFEIAPPFRIMAHCHCSRCRKATGTGHATNLLVGTDQLRWLSGEETIKRYDLPTAKRFGKWFCGHCGSPLPRVNRNGRNVVVPAGSLDEEPPVQATDHIFWDSRVSWGCPSGGLPTHTAYPDSW